jgi:hypothetical protein
MTFRDRLAGEQKIGVSHRCNSSRGAAVRAVLCPEVSCSDRERGQDAGNGGQIPPNRWDLPPEISRCRRSAQPDPRCGGAACCF